MPFACQSCALKRVLSSYFPTIRKEDIFDFFYIKEVLNDFTTPNFVIDMIN